MWEKAKKRKSGMEARKQRVRVDLRKREKRSEGLMVGRTTNFQNFKGS